MPNMTHQPKHEGMEHIADSLFVIPPIDQRTITQFKNALISQAEDTGLSQEVKIYLNRYLFKLNRLVDLAALGRYGIVGNQYMFDKLEFEFKNLLTLFAEVEPDNAKTHQTEINCSASEKPVINFTALLDILYAGTIIFHYEKELHTRFIKTCLHLYQQVLSVPLFYAAESATLANIDGAHFVPAQFARVSLSGGLEKIISGNLSVFGITSDLEKKLALFREYWTGKNLVTRYLQIASQHVIDVTYNKEANLVAGANFLMKSKAFSKSSAKDIIVVFSPHIQAKITDSGKGRLQIKVPEICGSAKFLVFKRLGKKEITELQKLEEQFRSIFTEEWGTSIYGMIAFENWSYPYLLKHANSVQVVPKTTNIELEVFDGFHRRVSAKRLTLNQPLTLRLQFKPDLPDFVPDYKVKLTHAVLVKDDHHGVLQINPTETGVSTVIVETGGTSFAHDLYIHPDHPKWEDLLGSGIPRDPHIIGNDCDPEMLATRDGLWEPVLENALGIVGVHAVVLHTGKVLFFCFDHRTINNEPNLKKYFSDPNLGSYQVWDPITGESQPVKPVGRNVFCAGQCQLPNGHILVAGGQDGAGAADLTGELDKYFAAVLFGVNNGSSKDVHTYDPDTDTWSRWPDMEENRYYPTCEIMADGHAIVTAGLSNLQRFIATGAVQDQNDKFEIFSHDSLFQGATNRAQFKSADQYPIMRLLPGTSHLFVHIHNSTFLFDTNTQRFLEGVEFTPPSPVGRWTYPMQTGHVLLPQYEGDNPRIFISGGSEATNFDYNSQSNARAVQGAYIFEYNNDNVALSRWRETLTKPSVARLVNDQVLLPDGTVFIVNGISGGAASGHNQAPVYYCEIFDPETETFQRMATPDVNHPRGYHSTAFLLPDGRVGIAGHTKTYNQPVMPDDTTIQVFDPPYLFKGPRPEISGMRDAYQYNETVSISYSGEITVNKLMMMRPCAVTHSVDMGQRALWIPISFNPEADQLEFTLPSDPSFAQPGIYMFFFLSNEGVPSVAHWAKVGDESAAMVPIDCETGSTYPSLYLGVIEDHRQVNRENQGDIIVNKIDQHCNVQLTSHCGNVIIREKIDQHCWVKIKAAGRIDVRHKIDQHCIVDFSCEHDINIGIGRDDGVINANSQARLTSQTGSVNISQKIDGNSSAIINTNHGSIAIGEKIDGNSIVSLYCPEGTITINQKIGENSQVTWQAMSLICPEISGDVNPY